MTRPLLVGELNPYGGDPDYALYPAPDGCSGHRLCCLIFGMRRTDYLREFERANLVAGRWSMPAARAAADELLERRGCTFILLGSKVAAAFGKKFAPFTVSRYMARDDMLLAMLPHPSGLCRLWNVPGAVAQARHLVVTVYPQLAPLIGRSENA